MRGYYDKYGEWRPIFKLSDLIAAIRDDLNWLRNQEPPDPVDARESGLVLPDFLCHRFVEKGVESLVGFHLVPISQLGY